MENFISYTHYEELLLMERPLTRTGLGNAEEAYVSK
jgi:hypothetical protein